MKSGDEVRGADVTEGDADSGTRWVVCSSCDGEGKVTKQPSKKAKLRHARACEKAKNSFSAQMPPAPQPHVDRCATCSGSGLVKGESTCFPEANPDFPHVAIIGGGLGGLALAVACRHRAIPFTIFERDEHFNQRSQGYGLTMQQASKALEGFGVSELPDGITSTKHVVHTPDGEVIGEWGLRKWGRPDVKAAPSRQNIHIPRQALRRELLEALGGHEMVQWSHRLVSFEESEDHVELAFKVGNGDSAKSVQADIVVGADGIRSSVRQQLIGDDSMPLRYLDCIVILGICPLENIGEVATELLDGETVFQTANGHERIYMMPFSETSVMWQLSFPLPEDEAKELNRQGPQALKDEALRRCQWHDPIPQILKGTDASMVTGYPAYDRDLLTSDLLPKDSSVTLLGDAAHPMSPFKGQGANQALLDALSLVRKLYQAGASGEVGVKDALRDFESEMLTRSAGKVKASAEAAKFLHTEVAICPGNMTRGAANNKES